MGAIQVITAGISQATGWTIIKERSLHYICVTAKYYISISRSKDVHLKQTKVEPPLQLSADAQFHLVPAPRRSCVIMIILLMLFIGDLVCVHVIHDVGTYGKVQKRGRGSEASTYLTDTGTGRHDTLYCKGTHWPNCGACPGAVRFETDTVRDVLCHETGLGTTILRSFAGHPFVHLAISLC